MTDLSFPLTDREIEAARKRLGRHQGVLLGVTGGIASGKSTVSAMLEKLGAPLVDFDRLARQVVLPGSPALGEIAARFGQDVLRSDGMLHRKKLSTLVFNSSDKRKMLEGITHPRIFEAFFEAVDRITAIDPRTLVQAAVPLLMELRLQPLFDKVLLVYATRDQQVMRLVQRDGIGRKEAARIIKAQMPIEDKRPLADHVISNVGSLDETQSQVEALWHELQQSLS